MRCEVAGGGRDHLGKAVHARVRYWRTELRFTLATGTKSLEPRSSSRWIVLGIRQRSRGRFLSDGARNRHWRQRAQSRERVCDRGHQADIRAGVATRRLSACIHPGSRGPDDKDCCRQCPDARRPGRPRSARPGERPVARELRLYENTRAGRAWPAHRLCATFSRGGRVGRSGSCRWSRSGRSHPAVGRR